MSIRAKKPIWTVIVLGTLISPGLAHADRVSSIPVSIYGSDLAKPLAQFSVPSTNDAGGFSLAVADLGTDGTPELLLGQGVGTEPRVRVLRLDGSEIGNFLAYDKAMTSGINITACDLNGDGLNEIAVIPQRRAGPHLKIFDRNGEFISETFAYATTYGNGASLTCGNLDGEVGDELVTLPAVGGGPHVRVWKLTDNTLTLWNEWFAFGADDRRGLVGTIHTDVLTIASQHASTVDVRRYTIHSPVTLIEEQSLDLPDRGISSVLVANETTYLASASEGNLVDLNEKKTVSLSETVDALSAVAVDTDADGTEEIVTVPARPVFGEGQGEQSIIIDLSEQRLYAYEHGVLANTFLISGGKTPYRTPLGEHAVLAKVPQVYYAGYNRDGTYWDLGLVPYNLRFFPHFYIHYAYWHHNFGYPMSHGCVNVALENMKWIYAWAKEGIPVEVRE